MRRCAPSRRNRVLSSRATTFRASGIATAHRIGASALVLALLLSGTSPARADDGPRALLLVVNGVEGAEPVRMIERAGILYADAADLRAAGIDLPKDAQGGIAIDHLSDATVERDDATQRLILTQRRHGKGRNHVSLNDTPPPRPLSPAANGIALAYDLTATVGDGEEAQLAGFVDARLFVGGATLASSAVLTPRPFGGTRLIRLDSNLTLTDPSSLFRATVGDVVGTSLPWTRAVRLAGMQMGSDFGLRPDLITYPLPSIAGDAAVPSTIDLIAQGGQTLAQAKVEPGDYLLSGVPVATGKGTIGLVVRDASGRQSFRTIDLYGAPQLLAPGLYNMGGDMGAIRRNYGRSSNDYGLFTASFSARRGMTSHLTLESHVEAANGFALVGAGAVIGVGTFGLLSANVAGSRLRTADPDQSQDGYQLGLAFERVAHPLSFQLSGRYVSPGYRDVAAVSGDPAPRSIIAGQLGLDLGKAGNASLGFTTLFAARHDAGTLRTTDTLSLITASYSLSLGSGLNLFASGLGDLGHNRAHSGSLGLSMALGGARSALAALNIQRGQTSVVSEYRDTAIAEGDIGYRFAASAGGATRLLAEGEYRAPVGRLSGAVERIGGRTSARLGMRGAVLLVDTGIFFADSLVGGFAIVDAGAPGVTVLQDHRPVGHTRGDGRYLVTNLRPWQDNLLAIDPLDLPADARAGDSSLTVRPGEYGPVQAKFAVDRRPAASVLLTDARGQPLGPGAQASLNGAAAVPIGYGGVAWLEGLTRDNRIAVILPDGQSCTVQLRVPQGALPSRLGPVMCVNAAAHF